MLPYTQQRMPDHQWLLFSLCALNPQHIIFNKGYDHDPKVDSEQTKNKYDVLKLNDSLTHPYFQNLPVRLVIKRKSLKSLASSNNTSVSSRQQFSQVRLD